MAAEIVQVDRLIFQPELPAQLRREQNPALCVHLRLSAQIGGVESQVFGRFRVFGISLKKFFRFLPVDYRVD